MLCVAFLLLHVCTEAYDFITGPEVYKCVCGATIHRNQRIARTTLHPPLLQNNNTPALSVFFLWQNIYPKRSVFACVTAINFNSNVIYRRESSFLLFETTLQLAKIKEGIVFVYLARARESSSGIKRFLPWIKWKYIRNTNRYSTKMDTPVFIGKFWRWLYW